MQKRFDKNGNYVPTGSNIPLVLTADEGENNALLMDDDSEQQDSEAHTDNDHTPAAFTDVDATEPDEETVAEAHTDLPVFMLADDNFVLNYESVTAEHSENETGESDSVELGDVLEPELEMAFFSAEAEEGEGAETGNEPDASTEASPEAEVQNTAEAPASTIDDIATDVPANIWIDETNNMIG